MARPAIHPGEVLADELAELGLSDAQFAKELHVPSIRIRSIIRGHHGITADMALRLGHAFGTDPELWLSPAKAMRATARSALARRHY